MGRNTFTLRTLKLSQQQFGAKLWVEQNNWKTGAQGGIWRKWCVGQSEYLKSPRLHISDRAYIVLLKLCHRRRSLTRRQQFHPHDGYLDLHATDADEPVENEEHDWAEGKVLEDGRLDESARPVQHHQDEQDRPHVVRDPEGSEGVTSRVLHGERVDGEDENREKNAREPCKTIAKHVSIKVS